jgi:hypothetical protein
MVVGVLMLWMRQRCGLGVVGVATPSMAWPTLGAGVFTLGGDERGCVIKEGMELGGSAGGHFCNWGANGWLSLGFLFRVLRFGRCNLFEKCGEAGKCFMLFVSDVCKQRGWVWVAQSER